MLTTPKLHELHGKFIFKKLADTNCSLTPILSFASKSQSSFASFARQPTSFKSVVVNDWLITLLSNCSKPILNSGRVSANRYQSIFQEALLATSGKRRLVRLRLCDEQ